MTKKYNKGSMNQNSPKHTDPLSTNPTSGDNSKGNKHNKDQNDKSEGVWFISDPFLWKEIELEITKGPVEIFAIWEYESFEDYEKIEEKVRSDQAHVERVKAWYDQHGGREHVWKHYLLEVKNEQIVSTVVKENSQAR